MPWKGKVPLLGKLASNIGKLGAIPSRIAGPASENLEAVIQKQFDDGVDPYGNPWEPLAERTLRRHGPPPLTDTTAMRSTLDVSPQSGAGVKLSIDTPANIHQTGANRGDWHMPARKILPEGTFPATWKDAIDQAAADEFDKAVGS